VPEALRRPTPHAPGPADDSSKEWVNFGVGQTGQVEKANTDKASRNHIEEVCERKYEEALKASKKRTKKWWQF
jgi:hypothetical protein